MIATDSLAEEQEEALLSDLAEADRHVRETPREEIDVSYLRRLLEHAVAQLPTAPKG